LPDSKSGLSKVLDGLFYLISFFFFFLFIFIVSFNPPHPSLIPPVFPVCTPPPLELFHCKSPPGHLQQSPPILAVTPLFSMFLASLKVDCDIPPKTVFPALSLQLFTGYPPLSAPIFFLVRATSPLICAGPMNAPFGDFSRTLKYLEGCLSPIFLVFSSVLLGGVWTISRFPPFARGNVKSGNLKACTPLPHSRSYIMPPSTTCQLTRGLPYPPSRNPLFLSLVLLQR